MYLYKKIFLVTLFLQLLNKKLYINKVKIKIYVTK